MRSRRCAALLTIWTLVLISEAVSTPAASQNLFEALGRLFGGSPRYESREREVPREEDRTFPGGRAIEEPRAGGPRVAYCVRLCDGRFFPISEAGGKPEQICSSLCPAAKTKIYRGSQIDSAYTSTGEAYAKLNTAFAYREKVIPQCGCTEKSAFGLAPLDIKSDPTLRAGDIVMSVEGAKVFKGSRETPYRLSDFSPAKSELTRGLAPAAPRMLLHILPAKQRPER